jgi:hydrogenase 3 maturation protease
MSLKGELVRFFGRSREKRVAIIGIGSPIRSDDAVGLAVVDNLKEKNLDNVLLLNTDLRPENFTGVIRQFNPTHVLLIDAAHLNEKPSTARIIPTQRIEEDPIPSTHHLPLTDLAAFIEGTMQASVALLGIQPESISFGTDITPTLREAAREIAETIREAIIGEY